jgi:hypothetical protein
VIDWGMIIPAFLSGALLSTAAFEYRQAGRLTKIETTLDTLVKKSDAIEGKLDGHIRDAPVCKEHNGLCANVEVLKFQVENGRNGNR